MNQNPWKPVPVACLTFSMLFLCPSVCPSAYVVELVNGGRFVVTAYWEKPTEITFYTPDGRVGIPKRAVREVRPFRPETAPFTAIPIVSPQAPSTMSKMNIDNGNRQLPGTQGLPHNKKIGNLEKRKSWLEKDLQEPLQQFRQALKNKDQEKKQKAMAHIIQSSAKLLEITKELQHLSGKASED
jgi:hypothetical protein